MKQQIDVRRLIEAARAVVATSPGNYNALHQRELHERHRAYAELAAVLSGQTTILPAKPVLPPVATTSDTRFACTECGGRNFAIDPTKPSIDDRWVLGRCNERPTKDTRCRGTVAQAIDTKEQTRHGTSDSPG